PANVFADFSTPIVFAPAVTIASSTPYARPQAAFSAVAGASGYTFDYVFSSAATDVRWDWNAFVSSGWLTATGGSPAYELPDLSSAQGFAIGWGIPAGSAITSTATVHEVSNGTADALLQVLAERVAAVHTGFIHRSLAVTQTVQ